LFIRSREQPHGRFIASPQGGETPLIALQTRNVFEPEQLLSRIVGGHAGHDQKNAPKMADRQPDQQPKAPPLRRAHDMNPREDRMDDEPRREPEDSEVEPEPSDKPRFRS